MVHQVTGEQGGDDGDHDAADPVQAAEDQVIAGYQILSKEDAEGGHSAEADAGAVGFFYVRMGKQQGADPQQGRDQQQRARPVVEYELNAQPERNANYGAHRPFTGVAQGAVPVHGKQQQQGCGLG